MLGSVAIFVDLHSRLFRAVHDSGGRRKAEADLGERIGRPDVAHAPQRQRLARDEVRRACQQRMGFVVCHLDRRKRLVILITGPSIGFDITNRNAPPNIRVLKTLRA